MQRILIVDSDPESAENLTRGLESHGFRAARVDNFQEAFEIAVHHGPDLIVLGTSVNYPEGSPMVESLKNHPSVSAVPVVGYHAGGEVNFPSGYVQVLSKPVDVNEAATTVKTILASVGQGSQSHNLQSVPAGSAHGGAVSGGAEWHRVLADLQQMMGQIRVLVDNLRGKEAEFGEDGEESFGFVDHSSSMIMEKLARIKASAEGKSESPLHDKELRHDFRNMIGSVTGFSELILMENTVSGPSRGHFIRIREICTRFVNVLDDQKAEAAAA